MNELATRQTGAAIAPQTAAAMVAASRELAEAQTMVQMAKMFPRDEVAVVDRILNACTRETLAEKAAYVYARGGQNVTGPSIRLAETIAQMWGNMQCGVRELSQRNGESECEAYAWDMETNARVSKVFHVSHIRHTKDGDKMLTDPRDIYEMVANQGARRLRACILAVIPGDVTERALKQCETTLRAKVDVTPERVKAMVEEFAKLGVSKEQIEKRIQRRLDAIQPAQFLQLGQIFNSIRDGMSKPEEWFEEEKKPADETKKGRGGKTSLAEAIGAKKQETPAEDLPL